MRTKTPLFLAALALFAATGCSRDLSTLRVAYSPSLPHAALVVGLSTGRFATAGGVPVQASVYSAGPSAIDALLYRDVDIACVGPVPALSAYARSKRDFVIVSGAAEGGAALVASKKAGIKKVADLHNARVATPQAGSTQDVAARSYFGELGFTSYEHGGSFIMAPTVNTELLSQFIDGALQAAWTIEPWVSQLVEEGHGQILIDEATLWGVAPATAAYPTAVIIARRSLVKNHPEVLRDFLRIHAETTAWLNENPAEGQKLAEQAITRLTHRAFASGVFAKAWARVHLTTEISQDALKRNAETAARVGFLPLTTIDFDDLIDLHLSKSATNNPPRS